MGQLTGLALRRKENIPRGTGSRADIYVLAAAPGTNETNPLDWLQISLVANPY